MKKLFIVATVVIAAVMMSSCSASHKLANKETEIEIPLSGPQYQSDANFWRTTQTGTSQDMAMSKKVALQNARQDLAALINSQIELVIENYGQNLAVENVKINESLYEELGRAVVSQNLMGAQVAGEKLFKLGDGSYRYHICLQVSKQDMIAKLEEKLAEEQKIKVEFDRERFRKVFDEEMKKLSTSNK